MKKIIFVLSLLLLLAGCGQQQSMNIPSPSPSVWGEVTAAAISPNAAPTPTPTPAPVPTPTPTPTPQPTFEDVQARGYPVRLQYPDAETRTDPYHEINSVLIDELTYVKVSDLQQVYTWLIPAETEDGVCFPTIWGSTTEPFETPIEFHHIPLEALSGRCIRAKDELWVPLRALSRATGLYLLWDSENSLSYVCPIPDTRNIPQGVRVPILLYHEVDDEPWSMETLFMSCEDMRLQLQYLQDNGYEPIFFSDLIHLSDYDKPVLLTLDDGYVGNYENLLPLLKEFNMKVTIFIIPELLDTEHYLTTVQVQELAASSLVSIQSHTMDHTELGESSYTDQLYQIKQSQLEITRITGRIPYVLSYPCGSFNDDTLTIVPGYYSFCVKSIGGTWYTESSDYFTIERSDVPRSTQIGQFAQLLE